MSTRHSMVLSSGGCLGLAALYEVSTLNCGGSWNRRRVELQNWGAVRWACCCLFGLYPGFSRRGASGSFQRALVFTGQPVRVVSLVCRFNRPIAEIQTTTWTVLVCSFIFWLVSVGDAVQSDDWTRPSAST